MTATSSPVDTAQTRDPLREALDRVAKLEASLAPATIPSRLLRKIGPTRWFAAFYRRFGPLVDPWLLRKTGGRIATQVYGFPALLLISTGSKSGQKRTSPLLYTRDGDDFLIVGTNFGTKNHPAWTGNLLANPRAEIVVGEDTISVGTELVDPASFERLWPRFVAVYGGYDDYLKRLTHRSPRMFRLKPQR